VDRRFRLSRCGGAGGLSSKRREPLPALLGAHLALCVLYCFLIFGFRYPVFDYDSGLAAGPEEPEVLGIGECLHFLSAFGSEDAGFRLRRVVMPGTA